MSAVPPGVTEERPQSSHQPLVVAVPHLARYHEQSGIGRVLRSLQGCWGEDVSLVEAQMLASRLPVLRNVPTAMRAPAGTAVILLPQLTGAQALRDTAGIPSVAIVHDIGIVDCPADRTGASWISRQSVKRSFSGLRHATRIVTDSHFTERRLLRYQPELRGRVTTIPAGVGPTFVAEAGTRGQARDRVAALCACPLGSPLLLYVGSELPRKNVSVLLEALSVLRTTFPHAQLLKVGRAGDGRWRAQTLAAATQFGLRAGEDVVILEDIDDAALVDAYRAADVFVSASLYEGFGLPALEAMAVGTPVVVSRCAALPEVVGDAGWLAEPVPGALAAAVATALGDPERERRIARGRLRAAYLNWNATAQAYLDLLRRVAGQPPV
jgi:glycosyltransferase involved in cell wall biosynthesis